MEKKVFIARDLSGTCFVYDKRPTYDTASYCRSGGDRELLSYAMSVYLGIPYPEPGEMIEWPPQTQTAAPEPEPPAETLVPITILEQLTVGDKWRKMRHDIAGYVGVLIFISTISALFYAVLGLDWISAGYKARIINREYGTHYTQEEVFYASDVINTIRQIQRNRIELNGNLMKVSDSNQNTKQGE